MIKVAGLDIGYTMGWTVIGEGERIIMPLKFEGPKNEFFNYKTVLTFERQCMKDRPDLVVFEDYLYGGNAGFVNMNVIEMTGMIKKFLIQNFIAFLPVHPPTVRLGVMGKGNSTKSDVRKFVIDKIGELKVARDDAPHVYDSVLLAMFGDLIFNKEGDKEYKTWVKTKLVGEVKDAGL